MTCKDCPKYTKCTKPCEDIEKILQDEGIKSAQWIRPQVSKEQWQKDGKGRWREIPFSALNIHREGEKDIDFEQ